MVGLQLQGSTVVHLGQHVGAGWRSWCWRLHAAHLPDAPGLATKPDWRGRGGGRPVEWLRLAEAPEGHTVCRVCLRRWSAEHDDVVATLQRLGQPHA